MIDFQSACAQTGIGSATVPVASFGVSPNASLLCASPSLWQKFAVIRAIRVKGFRQNADFTKRTQVEIHNYL